MISQPEVAIFLHPTPLSQSRAEKGLGRVGRIFSRFRSERKPDLQTAVDIESKRRLALCLFLCASCLDQFIMVNDCESGVRFRACRCHWRPRLFIILYSPFRNRGFRDCGSAVAKRLLEYDTCFVLFALSCAQKHRRKIDDLSEFRSNERIILE